MTKRVIHVGVGSFGRRWLSEFLAANDALHSKLHKLVAGALH